MLLHIERPIYILMEDELVHTDRTPFCSDPTCTNHSKPDLIAAVNQQPVFVLLTAAETTNYMQGKMP